MSIVARSGFEPPNICSILLHFETIAFAAGMLRVKSFQDG